MKSVTWRAIGILAVLAALVVASASRATADLDQHQTGVVAAVATSDVTQPVVSSQGASINQETYSVNVLVPASVPAGKEGTVTVAITVKPGWKLNQEFPTKLVVTAPSGVTLKKDKLRAGDATVFSDKKGSFPVVFTAANAGAKAFSAKLRFAVCTDATCEPKTEELSWAVTVN